MPLIVYSALRLGLFALALVGLWAVGMRDWLLVLVAAVVAWALSYVLLAGPRDAAALWLSQRVEGRSARFSPGVEADAAAEDAEAEAEGGRSRGSSAAGSAAATGPEPAAGPHAGAAPARGGGATERTADPDEEDAPSPGAERTSADGDGQSASPRPSSTP